MTKDQLLAAVPVHLADGPLPYIRLADIPSGPWREEFAAALDAIDREPIEDESGACAYDRDWAAFVAGELPVAPSGLEPDDESPDLTPAQLRALVLVLEPCGGVPAKHVRVIDIPRPHREAFLNSMTGSTIPFRAGESALGVVYAHDWLDWVAGYTPGFPEHGRRWP